MARMPILSEEQEAIVQALKAFEVVVTGPEGGYLEEALGWLHGNPFAYAAFFGMVRAMVHRDIAEDPRTYVELVKQSATRHYGIVLS